MTDEEVISEESVKFYLGEKKNSNDSLLPAEYEEFKLNEAKEKFEKNFIMQKLDENGHNVAQTAQTLGIYPSNLHGKIKKYGIEIKKR